MAKMGAGITNKQAKYLAALCREMRTPYMGRGLTRDEASLMIDLLKAQVEEKRAKISGRATTVRYECPVCGGPHSRADHPRLRRQ